MAETALQTNSDYRHAYIQRQLAANPTVADHSQVQGGGGDSSQKPNEAASSPKAAKYEAPKGNGGKGTMPSSPKPTVGSDAGTMNPPNVGQPPTITAAGSSEDQAT